MLNLNIDEGRGQLFNIAQRLLAIDSPSGYTEQAAREVEQIARDHSYPTRRTNKGSVIVSVPGREKGKKIGLCAHIDTLGLMVRSITADGMLMTTETGNYRMATFTDGHMNRLFERFVLQYYRSHHKELSPNPDEIEWNIYQEGTTVIDFLPTMRSDIVLHRNEQTLIIDTKYYSSAMQQRFDKQTIHSANLYQIYTYVKNMDTDNSGNVSGMLLYAKTDEDISPTLSASFGKNRIMVKTLDLSQDFAMIAAQLDKIAQTFE